MTLVMEIVLMNLVANLIVPHHPSIIVLIYIQANHAMYHLHPIILVLNYLQLSVLKCMVVKLVALIFRNAQMIQIVICKEHALMDYVFAILDTMVSRANQIKQLLILGQLLLIRLLQLQKIQQYRLQQRRINIYRMFQGNVLMKH